MSSNRQPNIPEEGKDEEEIDDGRLNTRQSPIEPPPALPKKARNSNASATSLGKYTKLLESCEVINVSKRSSVVLPTLRKKEKEFFDIVVNRDVDGVRKFLNENPDFNINCVNFQGVSPIHVAVETHCESVVQVLLEQPTIDLGDCVLRAIRDNQPSLLSMLLERQMKISSQAEFRGAPNSTEFPEYITPLLLAAQCGHYEIIDMLLQRGHAIETPHPYECSCKECKVRAHTDDLLNASAARLHTYRALTNPAYMCHTSNDPILAAFELSEELRRRAHNEPEFHGQYLTLAQEVSNFAVELLDCCRTTEEVELVLKQQRGLVTGTGVHFPRLQLAMALKQKEFVAHPSTQQVLQSMWVGEWKSWKSRPKYVKLVWPIVRAITLPVVLVMWLALPDHKLSKQWAAPASKLVSHMASYLLFLIFIFLESNMSKSHQTRGPPESGLEPLIIIYVIGFIWSSLRMCIIKGPANYFKTLWHWSDVAMETLFILTFFFWLGIIIDIESNDQVDLERKYWHHLDPALIAEGLFTVAVILAYLRLMFLFQLDYALGPLQISLGKMSADIAKFIAIFTLLILSFSAGLTRLYNYYDGMIQTDVASGVKTVQVSSFVNFESTLKTLFWALFCMSPLESADVIIENLPGETDNSTIINKHTFTEAIGYIAFACFEVMSVIVILNMLIATMSNTFQRVTDNVDVEWTFGRASIYMDYIAQTTLPSPYNLVPTPNGLKTLVSWVKGVAKGRNCCSGFEIVIDEQLEREFHQLVSTLVQRYFREKDAANDVAANNAELEAIKMDVAEIKSTMKIICKNTHGEWV